MVPRYGRGGKRGTGPAALAVTCLALGVLLVVQLRTQSAGRQASSSPDWSFAVADLVDSNARLRDEIAVVQGHLADLEGAQNGGTVLESLVNEVNRLRITNGLVKVSGPGIQVIVTGPVSVLDLQDLINELRNAGAEALAVNGQRLVTRSTITTDGSSVLVDGQAVQPPFRLQAIGDPQIMEAAVVRPGGVISLLRELNRELSITTQQETRLTLPVSDHPAEFHFARAVD